MKKHILCFGDSNTFGFNARTTGRFDEDIRWTRLLQNNLGDNYLVIEEGLGGRTTVFDDPLAEGLSGISYITPCLRSHRPIDLLVIMLGTNDCKNRFGVSALEIGIGMQRLIQKAKSTICWTNDSPNILVVAPKNIGPNYDPYSPVTVMGEGCYEKSKQVPSELKRISELEHVQFFDANEVISDDNMLDSIHLDEKGHKILSDSLGKIIKEYSKIKLIKK